MFHQAPPELDHPFEGDRVLRSFIARHVSDDVRKDVEGALHDMGDAARALHVRALTERDDEPELVQWDAWGHRIDRIELTSLWKDAARIAVEKGVVWAAYEKKMGEIARIHQFALAFVIDPSWHVYSCPLAMTDGAARTLLASKNTSLIDRAVTRLISRDPNQAWTSGQWMTERTGGSDVAISETAARPDGDEYRLYGTKWFTSATTSEMALTLARPDGNPPGGSGLALFYVETRDAQGALNGIQINRLKDKLGTRMVPTAELTLDGTRATAVIGTKDGIKHITPMLAITRTWNAVCAAGGMRRGMMLTRDYARRRIAFGAPLAEKPLHRETLAVIEAETQAAFFLAFRVVQLLGREEHGVATEGERELARLLVPLAKLVTGKQGVAVASEVLESFGGAGYVEDTGLPRLLRDAQVLPIWEGTTNVLSLDILRVLRRGGSLDPLEREIARCTDDAPVPLREAAATALAAMLHAKVWITHAMAEGPEAIEAGARRFAMTLGRAIELALLIDHATWALTKNDGSFAAAARTFSRQSIDSITDARTVEDSSALLESTEARARARGL